MNENNLLILINKWNSYLEHELSYSKNTILSYENDLNNFLAFLNNYINKTIELNDLQNVTTRTIRAWLAKRKINKFLNSSTIRALSSIKSFYKFLYLETGEVNDSIFGISGPRKAESLPRALSIQDTEYAISKINNFSKDEWIGKRDVAMLLLIYSSGLRISEILSITKNDLKRDVIRIKGKGGKERIIPWIESVRASILNYVESVPYNLEEDEPIFLGKNGKTIQAPVFRRQLIKLRRALGLPESTTPHTFRHNFATHLLENGADLRSIQELLGHKNLSTTQNYTKVNFQHLYSTYLSSHPFGRNKTNK